MWQTEHWLGSYQQGGPELIQRQTSGLTNYELYNHQAEKKLEQQLNKYGGCQLGKSNVLAFAYV
jgi:hypothetical protein